MLTKKSTISIVKGILTKKSPIYVQLAVTKRCNLRCKMCGIVDSWKNEKDMSLDEIEKISDILDKLGTGVVLITGGEPFLREDLPDIIKIFSRKHMDVRLQTNGIFPIEEKIRRLVRAGLREVSISLDSLEPKKQDFICNHHGAWKKIMNSIYLFSNILPKNSSMPVINTVLSKLNLDEITNIATFSDNIGFYNSIIPVHIKSNKENKFQFRGISPEFEFLPEDFSLIDKSYLQLINMKSKGIKIYNSLRFLKECPDFLKFGKIYWKCHSPSLYFSISPSGFFSPCIELKTNISMLEDNFIRRYRSESFKKTINSQVKHCSGCMYGCWPEITYLCEDYPTLIERIIEGIKIIYSKRKPISYEEILYIAKTLREKE